MVQLPPDGRVTQLLNRLQAGDDAASAELIGIVYGELKRLAEIHMARQPGSHTLQPTALVHEAWMRLADQTQARFESRARFFAMASRIMRTVLVDHARARAARHDANALHITVSDGQSADSLSRNLELLSLDDALKELARTDEELLRIVELRFFGGLTSQEAAGALDMPLRSYERGLQVALIWLHKHLK